MIYGADISNLQGHPDSYRGQQWYVDAQFVLVQAIEPPAGFPGSDFVDPETGKRGYTGVQLRTAKQDGKKVGVYAWLWNGLADTRGNILARLATVPPSVQLDMRPWVDVEDTTPQMRAGGAFRTTSGMRDRIVRQLQCEGRPWE